MLFRSPPRLWADRDPAAAARLAAARQDLAAISEQLNIPVENLASPDAIRRLAWRPPEDVTPEGIDRVLYESGARDWQRELLRDCLARAMTVSPPS